ncbi:hypothetical protein [Streptomyces soliscabiei]|uniref:hypothetical protein n=1 Tax=Streptomyces soliscabiei TaxID=588897 RepID=UPI0029BAE8B0|nr:hypothetical protein [Streptomyces sp. NY05-11A]MDX2675813.1 hypothetical protein [Streptomyces sp. NY05-11A]
MSTDQTRTWIRRASTAAGLAYTAVAEYELARRLGARVPIAVMLPVSIDCYVIAALKWFRPLDVTLSLVLMCSAQVAAHALEAGVVSVSLNLVTVVSLLVPLALWRTHALARDEDKPDAPADADGYAADLERVPVPAAVPAVPEAYPALPVAVPAIPRAVPAGVRLLPIVARPEPVPAAPAEPDRTPVPEPEPVDEYPVPGGQVPLEYAVDPDWYKTGPDPEAADEDDDQEADPLVPQVRADFPGEVPGVRKLKDTYGIGQPRAQRIRDQLTGVGA